jgi:hypothetical protein
VRACVLVDMAFEPWLGRSLSSDLVWLLMLLVVASWQWRQTGLVGVH